MRLEIREKLRLTNIARIVNADQCHSKLLGNNDYHEFRFRRILRWGILTVIILPKVTSL